MVGTQSEGSHNPRGQFTLLMIYSNSICLFILLIDTEISEVVFMVQKPSKGGRTEVYEKTQFTF